MDVSVPETCKCLLLTCHRSFIESNLLVICCCLPTLRRFFRHVAPRIIGEHSHDPSRRENYSRGFRTWGSMSSRPQRQFDTLMNTVDHNNTQDIPLAIKGHRKRLTQCNLNCNVKDIKADSDSEEAILYGRTLQTTCGSAEGRV
jgi:hypothetical protein